jgi:hypothetical protein
MFWYFMSIWEPIIVNNFNIHDEISWIDVLIFGHLIKDSCRHWNLGWWGKFTFHEPSQPPPKENTKTLICKSRDWKTWALAILKPVCNGFWHQFCFVKLRGNCTYLTYQWLLWLGSGVHKKPKHKINIREVLVTRSRGPYETQTIESLSGVGQGDQIMDGVLYNYKL